MTVDSTVSQTAASGVGTLSIAYPATLSANSGGIDDMLILIVGYGNSASAAPTTPSGFTILGAALYGGTGSWGVDTGQRGIVAYYRDTDGSETGSLTVTNGGSGSDRAIRGVMYRIVKQSSTWETPVAVYDDDSSSGTALNIAPGSNPGGSPGDLVIAAACWVPTGNNTSTGTSSAISWTGAGVTTTAGLSGTVPTTSTNGLRLNTYYAPVTGIATGNVSLNLTLAGASAGVGVIVRLRATGDPPVAYVPQDQAAEPWSTFTLDGTESTGNITSYTWTQTAGTSVSLGGSGATRTFEVPASIAGEFLTFELEVDDGTSTSTASVDVESMPVTEAKAVGGVWVPLRRVKVSS